jgi:hypothetical protein
MGEFETINEALIACVKALGGSKQVGHKLWPEKTLDTAQRHLLACLNEDKPERLSPEQLVLLMRLARERGFHMVMQHLAETLGYAEPQPIEPRDELADLLRQTLEAQRDMQRRQERIERLLQPAAVRGVAA